METVERPRIRKLTQEEQEIFSSTLIRGAFMVPVFRDALSLLRPFYDESCQTAYVDPYSRVGLGKWFFEELNVIQRTGVILHESMHVLNNYWVRLEAIAGDPRIGNYAHDFEINCGLDKLPTLDMGHAVFPDMPQFGYERYQTFEQYYHLLNQDLKDGKFQCPVHGSQSHSTDNSTPQGGQQGDPSEGQSSSGEQKDSQGGGGQRGDSEQGSPDGQQGEESQGGEGQGEGQQGHQHGKSGKKCTCDPNGLPVPGNGGTPCDEATESRSAEADEAGVARASDAEQSIAKKNTLVRIQEELKKPRTAGNSHMHDFLSLAEGQMMPPRVSWQSIFRRIMAKNNDAVIRGKSDFSYRRTNRRAHDSEFVFPGLVQYSPSVMFAIDTSGSMQHDDYYALLSEIEGIIKATSKGRTPLNVFSIDTKVENFKPVRNVKQVSLQGGGGTDMAMGLHFVNALDKKKRPDIFVLATDGFTDWNSYLQRLEEGKRFYRHVLLVTNQAGFNGVPDEIRRLCSVIDISPAA